MQSLPSGGDAVSDNRRLPRREHDCGGSLRARIFNVSPHYPSTFVLSGFCPNTSALLAIACLHNCLPLVALKIWLSLPGPYLVPFTKAHGGDIVVCFLILCIGRLFLENFERCSVLESVSSYSSAYLLRQWV